MSAIDKEALRWVVRKSTRPLDADERTAFDAWFSADVRHQGAFLRATAIDEIVSEASVDEPVRAGLERPEKEWAGAAWMQPASRRAFLRYGGLAAGVALVVGAVMLPAQESSTVLATVKGEFRKVPLADSSVVSLNSASQVEVRLSRTARHIDLKQGEAWFDVAKDKSKPFVVAADDVRVRAVGTAFAVRRFSNGADILVTEGTVEVWSQGGTAQKRLLHAGEQAFVGNRATRIAATRAPLDIERKLAWRQGRLVFRNQTLGAAVADFNRYSARRIVIADPRLMDKTLVGQYQIDAPEHFARDVGSFLEVPVSITGDSIVIGKAAQN
ncbi:FecR family protein [Massilia varians]|uniref:FecR family protein n=1 Tax=Massilia varians TaxID=457921 RepID=UPI002553E060|nr:FecR domain-containing protein [Massilia varians]MDK6076038.1 FecR domain-containing protein [Massilia varians]